MWGVHAMTHRPICSPVITAAYRIQVQGSIAPGWSDWFGGLVMTERQDSSGQLVTTLSGLVPDQPALRGILNRLWDLNLTLLRIERLPEPAESERTNDYHPDTSQSGSPALFGRETEAND